MAIPLFSSSLVLSSLIALAVVVSAEDSNVLLTGDVLATDGQLTYGTTSAIIQNDCNFVVYNNHGGFVSGTSGFSSGCTLTLNNVGQLVINDVNSNTIWTSSPPSATTGNYAAVLRPDGQVAVYGPAVWSTPQRDPSNADNEADESKVGNIPMVKNLLFSSQFLYNNATLSTRDYALIMGYDCNLALTKGGSTILWQSGTAGKGQNCFLRLDHRGQLTVASDKYKTVWASKPAGKQEGDYVLILQIHGQAVVYGPAVWSTASS